MLGSLVVMLRFLALCTYCAMLFGMAGCGKTPTPSPVSPDVSGSTDHGHAHHGAGPHGGTLTDWGGGAYHVEFTVDHDQQEVTVYLLGDDGKTPSPIKADEIQLSINDPTCQVTLKAASQEGDPEGSTSRFIGKHESLGVVREFAGTITGVVDGTPYSGDFQEEAHGAHNHP